MEYLFTFLELEVFAWTLFHSIWQFTLIGLAVMLLNRNMGRVRAISRYWILAAGLLSMPLVSVATYQLVRPEIVAATPIFPESSGPVKDLEQTSAMSSYESAVMTIAGRRWISKNAIYVFLFWACGILVLGLRMMIGQLQLLQLRAWGQVQIGSHWQSRMKELVQQLGIGRRVHLAESHLVKEPITFGFLKPIILFPVGLINALAQEEVEAILWHELAHIKRHDYLFNLLQSLLEAIFFYHPIVWLLSKEIRKVREECCDDLVLEKGLEPMVYAESLLHLARLINAQNNQFVMSTNSLNGAISTRIKRLFLPLSTPTRHKPITALLLVFLILGLTAYAGIGLQAQSQVSVELEQMNVLYLDVEHRINVAANGIPSAQLILSSEDLEVIPKATGEFVLKGKKLGEATLEISGPRGKIREAQYEVRRFPDAIPRLHGMMGGTLWKSTLDKLDRIELYSETEFPNPCEITSFDLTYVRKGKDPESVSNHKGIFGNRAKQLLNKAGKGDIYYFDKIQCQCGSEEEERKMPAMVFTIAVQEKKSSE